ncbi:MAG: hypothetical protein ACRCWI_07240 [Brevinema sp.]
MNFLILILLFLNGCISNNTLVKDGEVYLFKGKEQIILSFAVSEPSPILLDDTATTTAFLSRKFPKNQDSILIEGLTEDRFYNFFLIADNLFSDYYKNRMLLYGYIASLHEEFVGKNNTQPFIPISEFQNFMQNKEASLKERDHLLKSTVEYAIDHVFFVSILELLERPQRYFYPQNTREELFQILIYPEILTFWNYMQFRFGNRLLFDMLKQDYNAESWKIAFGEEPNNLESAYVNTLKESYKNSLILSITSNYQDFTNSLQLYMSGTKKSLIKE